MEKKLAPIFTKLLAETDALFSPVRDNRGNRWAASWTARKQFQKSGLPWVSRAATERGRKAAQRGIEEAVAAGMVKIFRPRHSKAFGVKLTDKGENYARRLCNVGGEYSAFLSMTELAERSKRPPAELLDAWIPETALAEIDYDFKPHQEFAVVLDLLLWALVRQWVRTNSDGEGRVYYCLTTAGWAQLESDWAPVDDDGNAYDPEAGERYDSILDAALARLDSTPPDREIGPISLPASMGSLPYPGCWGIDR